MWKMILALLSIAIIGFSAWLFDVDLNTIFMKGVKEGRRLEREDRNDDKLPRFYGD